MPVKKVKATLTLEVMYELNGEKLTLPREMLHDVATHAANRGLLSGSTSMEVESWNADVKLEALDK